MSGGARGTGVRGGGSRAGQARGAGRRRRDILVVVLIAAAALLSLALVRMRATSGPTGVARVTDGDGNVYEMPLDTDAQRTITTSLGTNVVEVRDGRVRVRRADCPNQDCVEQGWIDSSDRQIVCLPHRLYVEVVGGRKSASDVVGG